MTNDPTDADGEESSHFAVGGGSASAAELTPIGLPISDANRSVLGLQPRRSIPFGEQLVYLFVQSVREYSIYGIDAQGFILTWNQGTKNIKGYEAEEFFGKSYAELFTPEDQASGRPARLLAEATVRGSVRDEGWRIRKDGSRFWCVAVLTALKHEDGSLLGFGEIAKDTTAQHDAVEELRRSEERFRQLLEMAPDAIVIVDGSGNIVRINAKTERLFGYRPDELLDQKIEILMPERFRARHPQQRDGFISSPQARPMGSGVDLFGLHKDGREFPVEISLSPLETEDGLLVSSAIRDITEQRQLSHALKTAAEDLRCSNAELDQFAAIAAHDLREPLRMIASYLDVLQIQLGEKLDDPPRRIMASVIDRTKRMSDLINAILDYSHVGHQEIHANLVDAAAVARESLANLEQKIHDTHATIDCRLLPAVIADPVLLGQLLQNLVSNAIKFLAPDRQPKVVIDARELEHEWVLSIADNGIGIRPEDTERIFALFQRLNPASKYPGSGIGLATCQKIVERHHGRMWVESTVDVGTTFSFSLPKVSVT